MPFRDRADAGNRLAQRLLHLRGADTVVLGLPRGGVPVAAAVAEALEAPLDVIVARKLGVPHRPEVAMGAVGEGGPLVVDHEMVRRFAVSTQDLADVERRERAEVERRVLAFRGTLQRLALTGKTVIVVDDGLATGATARAACQVARAQGARRVIMAVPVAPPDALARLHADADELVCLESPTPFFAISQWYDDFTQTTDREVVDLLRRSRTRVATSPVVPRGATAGRVGTGGSAEVTVQAGQVRLPGDLTVPAGPRGFVLFAHGSGSGRRSPRNRSVAVLLNEAGLGTLLFDLLTDSEAADRRNVFDIPMLADRLSAADRWLRTELDPLGAPVGYFGASTGAAAALWAAARRGADVGAVVSRGGRPDLAAERLALVRAPTLLVVGGRDDVVLELNRLAQHKLRCESELAVVRGATHLFEEPGTLRAAAELARDWFVAHLAPRLQPSTS